MITNNFRCGPWERWGGTKDQSPKVGTKPPAWEYCKLFLLVEKARAGEVKVRNQVGPVLLGHLEEMYTVHPPEAGAGT